MPSFAPFRRRAAPNPIATAASGLARPATERLRVTREEIAVLFAEDLCRADLSWRRAAA